MIASEQLRAHEGPFSHGWLWTCKGLYWVTAELAAVSRFEFGQSGS